MPDGDFVHGLSDQATIAVLQATQLDHERRITELWALGEKRQEFFEAKLDAMYRRMDEIATRSDDKLDKVNTSFNQRFNSLQWYLISGVGGIALMAVAEIFRTFAPLK